MPIGITMQQVNFGVVELVIPGRPVAKGRPRLGRGGTYTPAATREFEALVAWHARAMRLRLGGATVHVTIELWSRTPLRGDIDNYAKAVLDGLQKGGAIDNDRQVASLQVQFVIGSEDKTVVHLRPLADAA